MVTETTGASVVDMFTYDRNNIVLLAYFIHLRMPKKYVWHSFHYNAGEDRNENELLRRVLQHYAGRHEYIPLSVTLINVCKIKDRFYVYVADRLVCDEYDRTMSFNSITSAERHAEGIIRSRKQ